MLGWLTSLGQSLNCGVAAGGLTDTNHQLLSLDPLILSDPSDGVFVG